MNTEQVTCRCGKKFMAKSADIKRGWAKSCSKSCAAFFREVQLDRNGYRNGNNKLDRNGYRNGNNKSERVLQNEEDACSFDPSWDAHKDWT